METEEYTREVSVSRMKDKERWICSRKEEGLCDRAEGA
jgi:hypothetical protein